MKKWLAACCFLLLISWPSKTEAAVWDGAEIVKGQTGKLSFSKDVKVYKKNANGQFESLVVKKGQYFRVYNIEKYNNQTYYWMSSGYRVQATDLTQFKAIPLETRTRLYKDPAHLWMNQNMVMQLSSFNGSYLVYSYYSYLNDAGFSFNKAGQFEKTVREGNRNVKVTLDPTDIFITENKRETAEGELMEVKQDTPVYWQPYQTGTTRPIRLELGYNYTKLLPKHTLLRSQGITIGDYHAVNVYAHTDTIKYLQTLFVKASDIEVISSPVSKGTWYVQETTEAVMAENSIKTIIAAGSAVTYYGLSEDYAVIGYDGDRWLIPHAAVAPH